jgi:hypothetical protein
LEADRSTMPRSRFLTKMRGYIHYRLSGQQTKRYGMRNFLVLTVTKSHERAQNLLAATRRLDQAKGMLRMFLFGSEQNYSIQNPLPILESIWATPNHDRQHSILE